MAERQHGGKGPAGVELGVEVHWCTHCEADRTVQIMQLSGDPEPVAVCTECGGGVDMWLVAGLVDPPAMAGRPGARPGIRFAAGQQGAA